MSSTIRGMARPPASTRVPDRQEAAPSQQAAVRQPHGNAVAAEELSQATGAQASQAGGSRTALQEATIQATGPAPAPGPAPEAARRARPDDEVAQAAVSAAIGAKDPSRQAAVRSDLKELDDIEESKDPKLLELAKEIAGKKTPE